MNKVNLLNIWLDNLFKLELLEKLNNGVVFTTNVDHLVKLQKDPDFFNVYNTADYRVCDSQILMYASKFLGTPFKEKVSGSDLFPAFYNYHKANETIKIFLLGSEPGIAVKAQQAINHKVSRKMVVGAHSPSFGFEHSERECGEIVEKINQSEATVLVVGLGAPKQEKWIHKYKSKLPKIKIFLALGATIDFEAGKLKRAPKWMSHFGLEWFYRILCEPKRLWKRYLVEDLPFFWLIVKQRFHLSNTSQLQEQINLDKTSSNKISPELKPLEFNQHSAYQHDQISTLKRTGLKRGCSAWLKPTSAINLTIDSRRSNQDKIEKSQKTYLMSRLSYR